MVDPRTRTRIWLAVAGMLAMLIVPLAWPMARAWNCYDLHANGVRAEAEIIAKLDMPILQLRFTSGPQNGNECVAKTSGRHHDEAVPGERFEVVFFDDRPGTCVPQSTVEASGLVLWSITGCLSITILAIFGIGFAMQRNFSKPLVATNRMDVDPGRVTCPVCEGKMTEGYLPLVSGIHWRDTGQPLGLPHALGGLPGTKVMRQRPRLHAFRCEPCEIVTFHHAQGGR